MRVVNVHVQQPRLTVAAWAVDEIDRTLGRPGGLMHVRIDMIGAIPHRVQVASFAMDPLGIVVPLFPVVSRRMREFPVGESIIDSRLGPIAVLCK